MHLSTLLDCDLVAVEQTDELTLLVELTAPSPTTTAKRQPATLQVVLDRSGSMSGDRLEGAKSALIDLVDRLDPADNLGVLAFAPQRVHCASSPLRPRLDSCQRAYPFSPRCVAGGPSTGASGRRSGAYGATSIPRQRTLRANERRPDPAAASSEACAPTDLFGLEVLLQHGGVLD